MKFSVGLIDELFGERVTLEIPGPDGRTVTRQVTEKWLAKMVAEKRMSRINQRTVSAHILDPDRGYFVETWIVGEDIDPELVEDFEDKKAHAIYVMTSYKKGKPYSKVMREDLWRQAKKMFESM